MKKILSLFCAVAVAFSASAAPLKKAEVFSSVDVRGVTETQKAPATKVAKAPKAKQEVVTVSFTEGVSWSDNVASGGWWQIYASDETYAQFSISNVSTTAAAGTYAWADLDHDWTYYTLLADEFGSDGKRPKHYFTDGSCTITIDETDGYKVTCAGTFTEEGGNTFNVTMVFIQPTVVVLPEGAAVVEYTMNFKDTKGADGAKFINVAVVGNDVYFQGMSQYIPNAWVKGTKDGNAVTFAPKQYMGEYGSYGSSFFFYNGKTVFTYDADANTYSATGQIYGVLAEEYYDGNYTNPVLSIQEDVEPIDVVIADAEGEYSSYYSDIVYTLTNAAKDTTFVFDIKLAESQSDVTLGEAYTLDDMWSSVSYTYAKFGSTKVSLSKVNFVKTVNSEGLAHIEAQVTDKNLNVYNLVYQEKPIVPSGEVVTLNFDVPMNVPQYYTDINAWEYYARTVTKDTVVAFVINSNNAESGAGTYTKDDLNLQYSGITIGDNSVNIYSASITVTETTERIDVVASILGKDAVTYNIKMFFNIPVATTQETITSNALEINTDYYSYYGVIMFDAADDKNAVSLTVNANGMGAAMAGTYVAGTDFNGTVTPVGGTKTEIFSGSITIAVSEDGVPTITGTVLAANNVEYTLNLSRQPKETNITVDEIVSEYSSSYGFVRYTLNSNDSKYRFFFSIYVEEGQEDIELNKVYTFTENMGGDINRSYGMELGTYNYIDYAEATFVKSIVDGAAHIDVAVTDVNGDKWNLTHQGQPTAVDNVTAANQAAKRIENGMLLIIRDGKTYNAQGAVIR